MAWLSAPPLRKGHSSKKSQMSAASLFVKESDCSLTKLWPEPGKLNEKKYRIGRPCGRVVQTEPQGPANTRHDCEVSNTYYACSEVKRLSEPGPYRLQEPEEARDHLLRVFLKDGYCIAIFRFGAVALPEEMEPKLRELVGREIGILRLDGYHVRAVDDA
jgi:hypothetical protein